MEKLKILKELAKKFKNATPNNYIGSIYVLFNKVNLKVYVGQTVLLISKRLIRHKSNAKLGCNEPIYNAIRKYGWDNFESFVIYQTEEVESRDIISKELDDLEKYYIKFFNSTDKNLGYNILLGGSGRTGSINNSCSVQILQFTTEGDFIKEWPSMHEIERELGYSHKSIGYFNYGSPRKSSYKGYLWIKKSEYYDGVFDDYCPSTKAVSCYDIHGKFLRDFESQTEASKYYNISLSQISSSCLGKILTTGDLIFIFSEDSLSGRIKLINSNSLILSRIKNRTDTKNRIVLQYSVFGEYINEFSSTEEAAKLYNTRKSNINKAAKGDKNTEVGCVWIFKDEFNEEILKERMKLIHKHRPSLGKLLKKYYIDNKFLSIGLCVRDYE